MILRLALLIALAGVFVRNTWAQYPPLIITGIDSPPATIYYTAYWVPGFAVIHLNRALLEGESNGVQPRLKLRRMNPTDPVWFAGVSDEETATSWVTDNPTEISDCYNSPGYVYTIMSTMRSDYSVVVAPCDDTVSGTFTMIANVCYTECIDHQFSVTFAATQYSYSIAPTTVPFGSSATATLTRIPGTAGQVPGGLGYWAYTDCQYQVPPTVFLWGQITIHDAVGQATLPSPQNPLTLDMTDDLSCTYEFKSPYSGPWTGYADYVVGTVQNVVFKAPVFQPTIAPTDLTPNSAHLGIRNSTPSPC